MEEKNWIDYIVAIATVFTPILIVLFSVIGWKYQRTIERKLKIEENFVMTELKFTTKFWNHSSFS